MAGNIVPVYGTLLQSSAESAEDLRKYSHSLEGYLIEVRLKRGVYKAEWQ
jgi:hypothetical protein